MKKSTFTLLLILSFFGHAFGQFQECDPTILEKVIEDPCYKPKDRNRIWCIAALHFSQRNISGQPSEDNQCCLPQLDGEVSVAMKFILPNSIINNPASNVVIYGSGSTALVGNKSETCWDSVTPPDECEGEYSATYVPMKFRVSGCGKQKIEFCFDFDSDYLLSDDPDDYESDWFTYNIDPCLIPTEAETNCITQEILVCCDSSTPQEDDNDDDSIFRNSSDSEFTPIGLDEGNNTEAFKGHLWTDQRIQKQNLEIKMYPNPVQNVLTVENAINISNFKVVNTQGLILFHNPDSEKANFKISTSNFNPGLYLITYEQNGQFKTEKIYKH